MNNLTMIDYVVSSWEISLFKTNIFISEVFKEVSSQANVAGHTIHMRS